MLAQISGDGADGILRRRCPRDFRTLRREHGRHQFEQRLPVHARPRRDCAARMSAQALLDGGFARSVLACDTEARANTRQHQSAGLIGRGHRVSLLCVSR
jgi:hypothetical protein